MVKLGKAHHNVFAMLENEYPDNPEYARNARREYDMRTKAGVTQAEMADATELQEAEPAYSGTL